MQLRLIHPLMTPRCLVAIAVSASAYGALLLNLDQLLFVAPYVVISVPAESVGIFLLDVILSIITVLVLSASVRQTVLGRRQPTTATSSAPLGIITTLVAGACPCNYLVPLLTVAGGLGGALGAFGTVMNDFEIPLKIGSLTFLFAVALSLERTLKASKVC